MKKHILGCNIDFRSYENTADAIKSELENGLLLSALCEKTGVETSTVQNWVKRGYLSKPNGKKYTGEQAAEVIFLNNIKNAISLDEAARLLRRTEEKTGLRASEMLSVLVSALVRATRFNSTDGESLKSVINIELRSQGIENAEVSKLVLVTALSALCADYRQKAQDEIK